MKIKKIIELLEKDEKTINGIRYVHKGTVLALLDVSPSDISQIEKSQPEIKSTKLKQEEFDVEFSITDKSAEHKPAIPAEHNVVDKSAGHKPVPELTERKFIIEWQRAIYANAKAHGFWDNINDSIIPEKLCLIHSEVSEALEAYRNNIRTGEKGWIGEELADTVIRILDLCERLNIDLEKAISAKHKININREYKHGKVC